MKVVASLLLALLVAAGAVDGDVRPPRGQLRATTLDDVRPNMDVKHEMWSYRFLLSDGMQLLIDFRRADLGTFKGKVLGGNFSVLGFKGEEYSVAREYPPENLTFDEERQRLSVHRNIWFEGALPGSHRVYYTTRKKGVSYFADLKFHDIEKGCIWGDGVYRFGDDEFLGMSIPIPYARVTGKIAINGDTLNVSGTGYMDHVYESDRVSKLVDAGYRVVSHHRGWEVGLYFRPRNKFDASVVGYGAYSLEGGRALYSPVDMSEATMGTVEGEPVPTKIVLDDRRGRRRVIERSKNLQSLSLLREVGGIKKFFAKKLAGGDVLMYRGVGTIDVTRPMAYDFFIID